MLLDASGYHFSKQFHHPPGALGNFLPVGYLGVTSLDPKFAPLKLKVIISRTGICVFLFFSVDFPSSNFHVGVVFRNFSEWFETLRWLHPPKKSGNSSAFGRQLPCTTDHDEYLS